MRMAQVEFVSMEDAIQRVETLEHVHETYLNWLCLEKPDGTLDIELIDLLLAFACDRKIAGDPVWVFLIASSGGGKTELIRSLNKWDVYPIDNLTKTALISGKIDPETREPIGGLAFNINEKVLTIKDFTWLLKKYREDRDEIFGEFRTMYDGELIVGYGNFAEPIKAKVNVGIVAGVTPVIDLYTSVQGVLGERFLKLRIDFDEEKTVKRAFENQGKEESMREDLAISVNYYLRSLNFDIVPEIPQEMIDPLLKLAGFVAKMRTLVYTEWTEGRNEKIVVEDPAPEYGTRLLKQLLKLLKLLATVRKHETVTWDDFKAIRRVAEDTCIQPRIRIVKRLLKGEGKLITAEIQRELFESHQRTSRHLEEMRALKIVEESELYNNIRCWKLKDEVKGNLDAIYSH